jgi:hypothetical protein
MLDIPYDVFGSYSPPSGADDNTVYTFPPMPVTTDINIRSNVAQRFEISQGVFEGSVEVSVSLPSRGGAGVFRTVTVTARNTEEDVWLWISGTTLGTNHRFTELVIVPVPETPDDSDEIPTTRIEHIITASIASNIEISVIRRRTTADPMPNLVTGNYERVRLTVPPMIRETTLVPLP